MKHILCLLLASVLCGQVTFTSNIMVDDLSDNHARIIFTTSANSWKVNHWGTSPGVYPNIAIPISKHLMMQTHNSYVSGLPSGSPVYMRTCVAPETSTFTISSSVVTAPSGSWSNGTPVLTWIDSSSVLTNTLLATGLRNGGMYYVANVSGQTFRLANDAAGTSLVTISGTLFAGSKIGYATCSEYTINTPSATSVQSPIAPSVPPVPAYPTIGGGDFFVVTTCDQMITKYNEWKNLSDGVHREIRIPTNLRCAGLNTFTTRTGSGYVIVRSAAPDSALPPPGTRTRDEFLPNYATFVNNQLPTISNISGSTTVKGTACRGPGDLVGFTSAINPQEEPDIEPRSIDNIAPVAICTMVGNSFTTPVAVASVSVSGADLIVNTATPHGCTDQHYAVYSGTGVPLNDSGDLGRKIVIVDSDTINFKQLASQTPTAETTIGCINGFRQYGDYSDAASLPADGTSCTTEGALLSAAHDNIRWCVPTDDATGLVWRKFLAANASASSLNPPFKFDHGAKNIRIGPGIRIIFNPIARTLIPEIRKGSRQDQLRNSGLIVFENTSENIIVDRIDARGAGYPNRHGAHISINGNGISIINSTFSGADGWIDPIEVSTQESGSYIMQGGVPTKLRVENNLLSCAGICLFFPEGAGQYPGTSGTPGALPLGSGKNPSDIIVRRNTFYKNINQYMSGAIPSQTVHYDNRHAMECKKCERVDVTGNIIDGSYSSSTQGAPFLLTPVILSGAYATFTITSITDNVITFSGNTARALRGVNDQLEQNSYSPDGHKIAINGTTNGAHNNRIVTLLDVDTVAANTTATIVETDLAGSSTAGTATLMSSDHGTLDVNFRNNTITRTPYLTTANGHNITATDIDTPVYLTRQSRRFRIHNNLVIAPNKRRCVDTAWVDGMPLVECNKSDFGYNSLTGIDKNGGSFNFMYANHGLGHVVVTNNTVVDARGDDAQTMIESDVQATVTGPNAWLKTENNLWTSMFDFYTTKPDGIVGWAIGTGTTVVPSHEGRVGGLNMLWGENRWSLKRNVICCGDYATRSVLYDNGVGGDASDNTWLPANTVSWQKYSRPNVAALSGLQRQTAWDDHIYKLKYNSPFKSGATGAGTMKGTDGMDIGVDTITLDREQGKVINARAHTITATEAIIGFIAPDSEPCTVEVSTSASWGTGTRVVSTGDYNRNTTVTGLTTNTAYYARVLCAVQQPQFRFRTN